MRYIKFLFIVAVISIMTMILAGVDDVYKFLEALPIILVLTYFFNYYVFEGQAHRKIANYSLGGLVLGYISFLVAISLNLSIYDGIVTLVKDIFSIQMREAASIVWFLQSMVLCLVGFIMDFLSNNKK